MASQLVLSLKRHKSVYDSKIKLLSPAKINLYLNITGKYPGGYRSIESIVERISLFDEISIHLKKSPEIKICSNYNKLQTEDNLCIKAFELFKKEFNIPYGCFIFLKKNIPIGSGLGGGSSNAASTLIGLNLILRLGLSNNELYQFGAKLGSDVNFFLADSKFALISGRGEKVELLEIHNKFKHFIIWPGINVSTKKVYDNTRVKLTKFFNNVNMLKYSLKKKDAFLIKKNIYNALEGSAFSVSKKLENAKRILSKNKIFTKLTGSGGAFYTMFSKMSLDNLRNILPKDWSIFEVKTF